MADGLQSVISSTAARTHTSSVQTRWHTQTIPLIHTHKDLAGTRQLDSCTFPPSQALRPIFCRFLSRPCVSVLRPVTGGCRMSGLLPPYPPPGPHMAPPPSASHSLYLGRPGVLHRETHGVSVSVRLPSHTNGDTLSLRDESFTWNGHLATTTFLVLQIETGVDMKV